MLATGGATFDAVAGVVDFVNTAELDTFTAIEKIIGTSYADTMRAGQTTELQGFSGDDWIASGQGANRLDGGVGTDTVSYIYATSGVTMMSPNFVAAGSSWAVGDVLSGFENVQGTNYADTILGDSGNNKLFGESGNDSLTGLGGSDRLYGGNGNDNLTGDTALAPGSGDGADWLVGGAGADTLRGGGGADRFQYWSVADSGPSSDVIMDFSEAQGDKIDLSNIDADPTKPGWQDFHFTTGTHWGGSTVRTYQLGGNTYVSVSTYDNDTHPAGGDSAEMEIKLIGLHSLEADDFIL
jgi:Ca2+-binding RTX toxin-like protein